MSLPTASPMSIGYQQNSAVSIGPVAVIHPKVLPPQMIYQPQAVGYANTTLVPDAPSVSNDAVMYPTKIPLEHNTIAMNHVFEK